MNVRISSFKLRRRKRLSLELLEARELLATITVNTTADDTTANSSLSLRQAIEVSNGTLAVSSLSSQEQGLVSGAVGNTNTIDFDIPTTDSGYDSATGVWTIAVSQFPLPTIATNAAIIDGYSQPGSSPNTLSQGDNAKLSIALTGPKVGFDGLTIGQQGSQVRGLDIGDFQDGVVITAAGNVQVAGCFIGTDPTGEMGASNGNGVVIENSSNLIGGPNVADRNVISDNIGSTGIYLPGGTVNPLGLTPTGNLVENNFIGLDASGTKRLGNALNGVNDNGSGNTYGGTTAGLGNVISGNGEVGIVSTGDITIEGNYIGTDATGNAALGNGPTYSGGTGIACNELLNATSITAVISNNLVSGDNDGISVSRVQGSQSTYTISNNLIGTNAAGTAKIGNAGTGLTLNSVENATVQNNVISANYEGVSFTTSTASTVLQNVVLQGNLIGTDKTGTVALGNESGIIIDPGSGITIGGTGPGQGNVIANNVFGITVSRGQQDQFIQNSIYGNTGVPGYPAPGLLVATTANQAVAAPALVFTPGTGGSGTLKISLTESPNTSYVVEVFSNPSAQSLALAQGETFVKDVTITTDGTGSGSSSLTLPTGFYTATATDPSGNTSQFSSAVGSVTLPSSTTTVSSSQNPSTLGQQVTFTAVVVAPGFQGTPTGKVTFAIDGQAQSPVGLSVVGDTDEARFVTTALTAGAHSVTASYSGDANDSPSSGSLPTETVISPSLHATTTRLASSFNPSTAGQSVTFTAVVSAGGAAGSPSGSVIFTVDGVSQAPVALEVLKGSDQATFSIATLVKGVHTIGAAYSGDSSFAASSAASPLAETVNAAAVRGVDGPKIIAVQRFGVHMHPTVLMLTFDQALDPTSAVNLSNYRITDPAGKRVKIASAVFNASANTVTLRPAERINLHHTYQLTVIGTGPSGVTSTLGLLLDGTDSGTADSDYHGMLTWRNVVLTPAQLEKLARLEPREAGGSGAARFS